MGFFSAINSLFGIGGGDTIEGHRYLSAVAAAAFGFAFFFALVFPLSYFFPPQQSAGGALRFPGARRVVWPVILVACAAVLWLVVSRN